MLISQALPDGWTAHGLRRRFATVTYHGGHDLRVVKQLLGYASIVTTQAYIGTDRDELRDSLRWTS